MAEERCPNCDDRHPPFFPCMDALKKAVMKAAADRDEKDRLAQVISGDIIIDPPEPKPQMMPLCLTFNSL